MHNANCWLMALSFLLGLMLTFVFTLRRVKREVPVFAAVGAAGAAATTGAAKVAGSKAATTKMAAVGDAPYGAGSARVAAGAGGPAGWTIKGNEDSMLYHAPDSPSYDATIAEVWFRDAKTAEAAGFSHWDSRRKKK